MLLSAYFKICTVILAYVIPLSNAFNSHLCLQAASFDITSRSCVIRRIFASKWFQTFRNLESHPPLSPQVHGFSRFFIACFTSTDN